MLSRDPISRRRRGLLLALACAAALVAVAPADAHAAKDKRQQLESVEKALKTERGKAAALGRRAESLNEDLNRLRRNLVAAGARARILENDVSELRSRVAALDTRARNTAQGLARRSKELGLTLSALIRLGRQPTATLLAGPNDTIDTARGAMLLGRMAPELDKRAGALRRELVQLAALRADAERQRTALAEARRALDGERKALDRLLARKAAAYRKTAGQQAERQRRVAALARKAGSLRALMRALKADEKRRAGLERNAGGPLQRALSVKPAAPKGTEKASASASASPPPAGRPLEPLPGRSFAAARGTLPLPVRGRILEAFGTRTDTGGTARGITIETPPEATVIAPYDGQIVFAGPFRGYGELLIIAHGEGYHTLLAGMTRNYGVVGQWLLAGEPVGLMGNVNKPRPQLYVELRRQGVPINPLPWLAASERKVSG